MNKKQLLYILLFIFPLFSQAQFIDKAFVWYELHTNFMGENIKSQILSFEGSQVDYRYGMLPLSVDRISMDSYNDRLMLKLNNVVSEILEDDIVDQLDDKYLIQDKYRIFSENILQNEKPFADVMLIPIRYNPENKNFERILSCTVVYEIVEIQSVNNRDFTIDFGYNSVLSTGKWYRIATENTGIHKITYSELNAMGVGCG